MVRVRGVRGFSIVAVAVLVVVMITQVVVKHQHLHDNHGKVHTPQHHRPVHTHPPLRAHHVQHVPRTRRFNTHFDPGDRALQPRVTGAVREESRQEFHDAGDLHPDWEDIPPPPPPDEREQEEQQPVQQPAQVPLHSASNHAGEKTYHVVEGVDVEEEAAVEWLAHHKFALDEQLVGRVAVNRTVMVTWCNHALLDFALNWVAHCRKAGITNFLVGAMDGNALAALVNDGVPAFAMPGLEEGQQAPKWEERATYDLGRHHAFHSMGREKINLINVFATMGFHLLLSDVDTVWQRDPLPYFDRFPAADILSSSDVTQPTHENYAEDQGLEEPSASHTALNIGVMFVRATEGSRLLAKRWLQMLVADAKVWDQNAFNMLVRQNLHTHHQQPDPASKDGPVKECAMCRTVLPDRVFYVFNGAATVGILPVMLFAGGHHYFVAQLPQRAGVVPYVVHATFQYSGNAGKRHRLREAMLWIDPPEYYDHPRGFVTYEPYIPSEHLDFFKSFQKPQLLYQENTTVLQHHFEMMNRQIVQLRQAIHIAMALGKVLILPKFICGLERHWSPHGGVVPGSKMALPYECPLDHVMNVQMWYDDSEKLDFHFREHSFLNNPRTPRELKRSRGTVTFCGHDKFQPGQVKVGPDSMVPCPALNAEDSTRANLQMGPMGVHSKEARFHTQRVAGLKVLEVAHVGVGEMILWEHEQDKRELDQWFEYSGSTWCCVMPPPDVHPPVGHIHYDMMSQLVGTADRHGFMRHPTFTVNLGDGPARALEQHRRK